MKRKKTQYPRSKHIFYLPVLIIRGVLWFPALIIVHFFLKMEVKGKDNLKNIPNGRVIFAANHSSEIDPYAFQYSLSFPSRFVPLYFVSLTKKYYSFSKFGLRSFIYGGILFRLMGAYPVYKGLNNFEKAFIHHINILKNNNSLLLFPEGRKNSNGIGSARPGIIFLSRHTHASVVPVKISGTNKLDLKTIFLRKRKITITYGKPISYLNFCPEKTDLTTEDMTHLAEQVLQKIKEL